VSEQWTPIAAPPAGLDWQVPAGAVEVGRHERVLAERAIADLHDATTDSRTIRKPNFGWFVSMAAAMGSGSFPIAHRVQHRHATSPPGFAGPRRPK